MMTACRAKVIAWPDCVRVLVIDDDEDVRFVVRRVLEDAGYQVLEASNGRDGLQLCRTEQPSIVLLDAVMPHMDGAAFLLHKRVDSPIAGIPVVMHTGSDIEASSDVAAILKKPSDAREIVRVVRTFAKVGPPRFVTTSRAAG